MAVDKLVDSTQLDSDLTSVANAIRAKSGGSSQLAFPSGFVSEIGNIPSGGASNWALIGTKTIALSEYTDTSTAGTTDTEINVANTDYAVILVTVNCDTAVSSSTEWGFTVALGGRYNNAAGKIYMPNASNMQTLGTASLSKSAQTASTPTFAGGSYGLWITNAESTVKINRKAHATACTKLRGGNYTVNVYGLTEL